MDLECYLFLANKCKNPEEVFPRGSVELKLIIIWLKKLCRVVCNDCTERNLRLRYLGQLCACLDNQELTGMFLTGPPLDFELDPNVDFGVGGLPEFNGPPEPPIEEEDGGSYTPGA